VPSLPTISGDGKDGDARVSEANRGHGDESGGTRIIIISIIPNGLPFSVVHPSINWATEHSLVEPFVALGAWAGILEIDAGRGEKGAEWPSLLSLGTLCDSRFVCLFSLDSCIKISRLTK
jgi:hypothetical protein